MSKGHKKGVAEDLSSGKVQLITFKKIVKKLPEVIFAFSLEDCKYNGRIAEAHDKDWQDPGQQEEVQEIYHLLNIDLVIFLVSIYSCLA